MTMDEQPNFCVNIHCSLFNGVQYNTRADCPQCGVRYDHFGPPNRSRNTQRDLDLQRVQDPMPARLRGQNREYDAVNSNNSRFQRIQNYNHGAGHLDNNRRAPSSASRNSYSRRSSPPHHRHNQPGWSHPPSQRYQEQNRYGLERAWSPSPPREHREPSRRNLIQEYERYEDTNNTRIDQRQATRMPLNGRDHERVQDFRREYPSNASQHGDRHQIRSTNTPRSMEQSHTTRSQLRKRSRSSGAESKDGLEAHQPRKKQYIRIEPSDVAIGEENHQWCYNCHLRWHPGRECSKMKPPKSWTLGEIDPYIGLTKVPSSLHELVNQLFVLSKIMARFDAFVSARDAAQLQALNFVQQAVERQHSTQSNLHAVLHRLFAEGNNHADGLRVRFELAARHSWSAITGHYLNNDIRRHGAQLGVPDNWRVRSRTSQLEIYLELRKLRLDGEEAELSVNPDDVTLLRKDLLAACEDYKKKMDEFSIEDIPQADNVQELLAGTSMSSSPWTMIQPHVCEGPEFIPRLAFRMEDAHFQISPSEFQKEVESSAPQTITAQGNMSGGVDLEEGDISTASMADGISTIKVEPQQSMETNRDAQISGEYLRQSSHYETLISSLKKEDSHDWIKKEEAE